MSAIRQLSLLIAMTGTALGAQATTPPARICIAPPTAQMATGSSTDAANAVRESFTSFLTGPSLAVTPLAARLASQAREEAKQAGCPYVLFTALKHEHKQGSNLLGRMAGSAVEATAWELRGSAQSTAARVATNAAATAAATAARSVAGNVKSKDELTLDYRLETGDGTIVVKSAGKAKAESDGQDLLTPLVERASEGVAAAVLKAPR
jgi:outer membrane lipoprotein SlyB